MNEVILVGIGGALGAILRYLAGLISIKATFPFITLIINFTGALLIGFLMGIAPAKGLNAHLILFLKTGFLGGFTTFSTFSLEVVILFQNKQYLQSSIYAVLSLVLCIFGVLLGEYFANTLSAK